MFATTARRFGLVLAGALALATTACVVTPFYPELPPGSLGANRNAQQNNGINPTLQALSANPTSTSNKDDKIGFTVVATSPNNSPLQYNWSATKGVLSSNSGQIVYWSPTKSDGSLESAGDAQISVIITTAAGGAVTGTANVRILAAGGATVLGTSSAASTAPSTAPSASVAPSAAPSASPTATAAPSASPTAEPTTSASPSDDAATDATATGTEDAAASDVAASGT